MSQGYSSTSDAAGADPIGADDVITASAGPSRPKPDARASRAKKPAATRQTPVRRTTARTPAAAPAPAADRAPARKRKPAAAKQAAAAVEPAEATAKPAAAPAVEAAAGVAPAGAGQPAPPPSDTEVVPVPALGPRMPAADAPAEAQDTDPADPLEAPLDSAAFADALGGGSTPPPASAAVAPTGDDLDADAEAEAEDEYEAEDDEDDEDEVDDAAAELPGAVVTALASAEHRHLVFEFAGDSTAALPEQWAKLTEFGRAVAVEAAVRFVAGEPPLVINIQGGGDAAKARAAAAHAALKDVLDSALVAINEFVPHPLTSESLLGAGVARQRGESLVWTEVLDAGSDPWTLFGEAIDASVPAPAVAQLGTAGAFGYAAGSGTGRLQVSSSDGQTIVSGMFPIPAVFVSAGGRAPAVTAALEPGPSLRLSQAFDGSTNSLSTEIVEGAARTQIQVTPTLDPGVMSVSTLIVDPTGRADRSGPILVDGGSTQRAITVMASTGAGVPVTVTVDPVTGTMSTRILGPAGESVATATDVRFGRHTVTVADAAGALLSTTTDLRTGKSLTDSIEAHPSESLGPADPPGGALSGTHRPADPLSGGHLPAAAALTAEQLTPEPLTPEALKAEPRVTDPLGADPFAALPFYSERGTSAPSTPEPFAAPPPVPEPFAADPLATDPLGSFPADRAEDLARLEDALAPRRERKARRAAATRAAVAQPKAAPADGAEPRPVRTAVRGGVPLAGEA